MQVHSSKTVRKRTDGRATPSRGAGDEPTEIVIHVNMLKEGWDVTNLYTIVPLRAANARTLVEQSIGRGLRLPYGERTGIDAIDTLNIVAHDRFQEIVDDANKPDSPLKIRAIELAPEDLERKMVTVVSNSVLTDRLSPAEVPQVAGAPAAEPLLFATPEEQLVAQVAMQAIESLSAQPKLIPEPRSFATPTCRRPLCERCGRSTRDSCHWRGFRRRST